MIGRTWHWLSVCTLVVTLSLGASSCLETSRFRTGYATFFVEFYDPVIDRFGVVQLAYCARNLTFTGQIDTACVQLPMVYSFGMDAFVTCTYRDASGVPWSYTDLFYFWPGYIQEPACFSGFEAPSEEPVMDLARDSMLPRNGDGQVLIADDITLSDEQVDLSDLRGDLLTRTQEAPPAGLSSDEIAEEPIRTTETLLGEPAPGVNDPPELDPATQLERDDQGRVILNGSIEVSDEPVDLGQLREDLEDATGEELPDGLPGNRPGEPVRTSDTELGEEPDTQP